MPWVKLDDGFSEHPKLERAGPLAGWMHVSALCYCARNLTDGRIPKSKAHRLADVPKPAQLAAKLVEVGLWEVDGDDYVIHDYSDYNPSRAQVEAERQAGAERQRRSRESRAKSRRDNGRSHEPSHARTSDVTHGVSASDPYPYPKTTLEKSSQRTRTDARADRGRTSSAGTNDDGSEPLDATGGGPDERLLRAIDHVTAAEVQRAVDRGECRSRDGLTGHVRQRLIDEHYVTLLPLAHQGWTARDLGARIENPAHRPRPRAVGGAA